MNATEMNPLQQQVFGRNVINQITVDNLNKVLPQLENFKGKKIALATGGKAKGFEVQLTTYTNEANKASLRTYIHFDGYNVMLSQDVSLAVKKIDSGGYVTNYYKNDILIGHIDSNGKLTEVYDLATIDGRNNLTKVYDYDKVNMAKLRIAQLSSEISQLKSEFYHFDIGR